MTEKASKCGVAHRVKNVIVVDDTADNFGGTAQVAYVTTRVLADRGYNVVYFAGTGPVHERLADIRVVTVREKPFLKYDSKAKGALEGLSSRHTYRALRSLLSEFDPADTVLHIHSWTHALSSSIFDAIADMEFRSLVTLHEYFIACPNGGFFDYRRHEICHLKPCSPACLSRNCDKRSYAQKLYRIVRLSLQTKAIRRAKPKLAYLSEFTYGILRGNRFDDGDPTYLPNPIETRGEYAPSPAESREGYLFIGRMDSEKNPELFCEALTKLGIAGTLCGDGPLLSHLREKYPNLTFLGWCGKDELTRQARAHRALIMTSCWYEASPLVCLEVMLSAGVPSVVPDTCGATDYIENGRNGLWFKNKDLESLCTAILKLEDAKEYASICKNIERELPSVRRDRSYEKYAVRITGLYEGLYEQTQ